MVLKSKRILLTILCCFWIFGCNSTSPHVYVENSRLHSPEVNNKPFKLVVSLKSVTETRLETNTQNKDTENDIRIALETDLSLSNGFEVSYLVGEPSIYALKYQFSGASKDTSDKGNFSQAIRFARQNGDELSGRYSLEDSDDSSVKWKQQAKLWELSWILGYRLSKKSLVFGGPFYLWGSIKGEQVFNIHQMDNSYQIYTPAIPSGDIISQRTEFLNNDIKIIGANVALQYDFNADWLLAAEIIYSNVDWQVDDDKTTNFNFKVSYEF